MCVESFTLSVHPFPSVVCSFLPNPLNVILDSSVLINQWHFLGMSIPYARLSTARRIEFLQVLYSSSLGNTYVVTVLFPLSPGVTVICITVTLLPPLFSRHTLIGLIGLLILFDCPGRYRLLPERSAHSPPTDFNLVLLEYWYERKMVMVKRCGSKGRFKTYIKY